MQKTRAASFWPSNNRLARVLARRINGNSVSAAKPPPTTRNRKRELPRMLFSFRRIRSSNPNVRFRLLQVDLLNFPRLKTPRHPQTWLRLARWPRVVERGLAAAANDSGDNLRSEER